MAKKSAHIRIRLDPDQKAEIVAAAAKAGLSVSAWVLTVALDEAREGK